MDVDGGLTLHDAFTGQSVVVAVPGDNARDRLAALRRIVEAHQREANRNLEVFEQFEIALRTTEAIECANRTTETDCTDPCRWDAEECTSQWDPRFAAARQDWQRLRQARLDGRELGTEERVRHGVLRNLHSVSLRTRDALRILGQQLDALPTVWQDTLEPWRRLQAYAGGDDASNGYRQLRDAVYVQDRVMANALRTLEESANILDGLFDRVTPRMAELVRRTAPEAHLLSRAQAMAVRARKAVDDAKREMRAVGWTPLQTGILNRVRDTVRGWVNGRNQSYAAAIRPRAPRYAKPASDARPRPLHGHRGLHPRAARPRGPRGVLRDRRPRLRRPARAHG